MCRHSRCQIVDVGILPKQNVVWFWYEFVPSLTYCHDAHLATFSDESNRSRIAIVIAVWIYCSRNTCTKPNLNPTTVTNNLFHVSATYSINLWAYMAYGTLNSRITNISTCVGLSSVNQSIKSNLYSTICRKARVLTGARRSVHVHYEQCLTVLWLNSEGSRGANAKRFRDNVSDMCGNSNGDGI